MKQHTQPCATALLVIDVQKGLFEKAKPIYQAELLLTNITTLIHKARQAGVPVIFIQHANHKDLQKGSAAWQLHPAINPLAEELIIHKLHGNAFEGTTLRAALDQSNVRNVIITGLVTHGCVKATCLGALAAGYKVMLVSDGHSSYNPDAAQLIEKWNQLIREQGAEVMEAQKVKFAEH